MSDLLLVCNGIYGMNGMTGMRNITDFTCLSFQRVTPSRIDMNNILME